MSQSVFISIQNIGRRILLRSFHIKHSSNIITGHLNINSMRNKFELLSFLIGGQVNILLISEIKIDNTFLTHQFFMSGNSNVYQ